MGTEPPLSESAATPPLAVRAQGSDRTLPAGPSYTIGRDPQSDIVINEDRVSWQHAVLKHDGGSWVLEDTGSTNGTYVGSSRVTQVTLDGETTIRLGHPVDGPVMTCSTGKPARPPTVIAARPVVAEPAAAAPVPAAPAPDVPAAAVPAPAAPAAAVPAPAAPVPAAPVPAAPVPAAPVPAAPAPPVPAAPAVAGGMTTGG